MAMATASATLESSTHIQSESRVQQHSYQEVRVEKRTEKVKKKKSVRRHKDEGSISVSKSSEKLCKKLKASAEAESNPRCEACSRPVFAMERVKAERRVWHKECFRCATCNKQLTVETYQSEHTTLYCKPHFKQLFEPKPVEEEDHIDAAPPKKHQLIICESNPVELPPDVVRASDKPDLGIEELAQLDLKARFQVFERGPQQQQQEPAQPRPREKSTALLSKLAKFKAKGMDVGVSDEYLNGVPVEASSSEAEEGEDDDADSVLRQSYRQTALREPAVALANMSEIVTRFESGPAAAPAAQRRHERKQEIQNIRSRLFMGKQAKIKEMYEQSVLQSEQGIVSSEKPVSLGAEVEARAILQRFESGRAFNDENRAPPPRDIHDQSLFDDGIAKKSRSIFLELDANAKSAGPLSPPAHTDPPPKRKELPFIPKDVVRADDKLEDVHIETRDISDRFKFFETYKPDTARKQFRMTPPRQTQRPKSPSPEVYQDPLVERGGPGGGAGGAERAFAEDRHTASRMISVFRQMEQGQGHDEYHGPKPLKRFTPPPPGESNHHGHTSSEEEYSSEEEEGEDGEYSSDSEAERRRLCLEARRGDEALRQAQQLARTKSFRGRFENWAENEPPRDNHANSGVHIERSFEDDDGESQLETAKSLREKFENMKVQQSPVPKTFVPKVNRFV